MLFYRIDKRKIQCAQTKSFVNRRYIVEMVNKGIVVTYIDKDTGEDLGRLVDKFVSQKVRKKKVEKENSDLGPDEPFNKPKMNKCRKCKASTVNRFNCSTCLDKILSNFDDNYIEHTPCSSSDVEL